MLKILEGISLETSRDGIEGYISMEDLEIQEEDLNSVIEEVKGVFKVGLNEERLEEVLRSNSSCEKMLIAEGFLPIGGEDGYIKYHFDVDKDIKPKILENGDVDYKELDAINNVEKGDLLAELIPPRKGKNGFTVTGQPIFFKRGRKPLLRYGKNVELVKDEAALVAGKDGLVELKDNKVIVLEVLEISSLDSNSGNIYFTGTVLVKNNALNSFQIKADGNVEINGLVEGAYIENSGDLLVKRGIRGYKKLVANTNGNITTKFVESAIIKSNKNIIAEAIMHSDVESRGYIEVIGRTGLIVGGVLRAQNGIKAKTIGSNMATSTVLKIGIDNKRKKEEDKLKDLIETTEDNLAKIFKTIELLDKLKKVGQLDEEKAKLYLKLLKTKQSLESELEDLKEKDKTREKTNINLINGRVKVYGTIYPGVKISIGDSNYLVRDEMKHCTFYREKGEIMVGPY